MTVDGPDDIAKLREIGIICRDILAHLGRLVRPGITSKGLDHIAGEMLRQAGARSAPILTYNFPGHTCISVGDAVAHGIPDDTPLKRGQLINIDVSAEKDGFFADCGASFPVGDVGPAILKLLKVTKAVQHKAMMMARPGIPICRIGDIVEREATRAGYHIIEGLNGHGVGRWIHEEPTIPNKAMRGDRRVFKEGMVVAIEPFLATLSDGYIEDEDGWTLRLNRGGYGAQFEHSVVVTKGAPIILTA